MKKYKATALNSFISMDNTCFSFKKGDQITILDKDQKGWLYGSFNGEKEWFPATSVKINNDDDSQTNSQLDQSLLSTSLQSLLGNAVIC